jgi:hypothetical protein
MAADYLAAVWACGEGALLRRFAAARLQRLTKGAVHPPPEVVAPTARRVRGVKVERSRRALGVDAAVCEGIPVTNVPRTLVDLAAVLPLNDLARACHEAGVLYRTTPAQVQAVLARRPTAMGAKKLRLIMDGDAPAMLSRLERGFRKLLNEEALPLPVMNRPAGGRRVDCRWPERRVTIELDSYRFHNSRHSWEQDRRREREARARGDEFRRYTWGDVFEDRRLMLAELRGLLLKLPA